jgi:hypothetical protein|tara:strand:- start:226 stop:756 length:531 start_codon:yes stop_codon:yes gene_type:complete
MKKISSFLLILSIVSFIISCAASKRISNHPNLTISNRYVWLPKLVSLPAEISYDFKFNSIDDEFIPVYSFNKSEWGNKNIAPDALSWYLSPHRDDFTFRTGLFNAFPKIQRGEKIKTEIGKVYTMKCIIKKNSASYSIDGKTYATATYKEGTIPLKGYFGFAVYQRENINVLNIKY